MQNITCDIIKTAVQWCSVKHALTGQQAGTPQQDSILLLFHLSSWYFFFYFVIIWVNKTQTAWAGQHNKFWTGRSQMLGVQITRKDSIVSVFPWILGFFQSTFFREHFWATASANCTFFFSNDEFVDWANDNHKNICRLW